ncbi:hypothetical protein LMG28138_04352 [Pararobbsia alpina]|uniref:Uncharacterized protein n=1 Tax=Pararobbsia alpina TaxID=621374 RepID=A0A6S7BP74_9BURK|nr:hypothetical protein LMG28138_04352 [Pararobbsia alpina]
MRDLANRLGPVPPIEFLGAVIPVCNHIVHVANENGVASEIEEPSLFALCIPESADLSDQYGDDQ